MRIGKIIAIINQVIEFFDENAEAIEAIKEAIQQIIDLFSSFGTDPEDVTTLDSERLSLQVQLDACTSLDEVKTLFSDWAE